VIDPTVNQMKRYGVISCRVDTSLLEAARLMTEEDISSLVVQDGHGYLEGIITRTDLLRAKVGSENWLEEPVHKWMSKDVVTVTTKDHLSKIARLLLENRIHRVVVVQESGDHKIPVALISDADVIYHMSKERFFTPRPIR
jgi:CBS domain-containing protein